MSQDVDARTQALEAAIAKARALPTTQRVLAKQPRTVAEDQRRRTAGVITFADTPGRLELLVPLLVERGEGCRLYDLDGNELIDLHLGFWTQILGHSPPVVVEAVTREMARGTTVGVGNPLENELCEYLIEHVECAEMACLAVSGTHALMHALKLARAKSGRRRIGKFSNHFHGTDNDVSLDLPEFKPGVPTNDDTLVLPGSPEVFDVIRQHADSLAGILIEPAPPVRDPRPFYDLAFYKELRRLTSELGIVLVFDEVLRGFRSRFGATLDAECVIPDLTCFGKIIGGGLPLAAVVGRRDIMQRGATSGSPIRDLATHVPLLGTYSGNRIACAAGLAQLKYLEQHQHEIYPYIRDKGAWLGAQIDAHAKKHGLPIASLVLVGGMVMVRPTAGAPGPLHPVVLLQTYLRDQGCFFMGGPIQVSPAHREADLERISAAFDGAMANLVKDGIAQ
jgi:glutamate-1-semialdehyde aminotransferase